MRHRFGVRRASRFRSSVEADRNSAILIPRKINSAYGWLIERVSKIHFNAKYEKLMRFVIMTGRTVND